MATAALSPPALRPSPRGAVPRSDVRQGLRALLANQQGFAALNDDTRRDLAGSLARIGSAALDNQEVSEGREPRRPAMARAMNAGSEFSGVATDRLARTTRDVLNAVSFPRFVTELITGVFKAMNDSNQQQLTAFVELIRNVAQTTEGFADSNVGISGARQWLAEHFPTSFEVQGADEDEFDEDLSDLEPEERRQREAEIQAERDAATRLVLRPGATPPSEAALRTSLGVPAGIPVSASDPEALVPLARQVLARNRQQLLSTMIQMGLQRIVIESGRLNASMRFHIDTSSAASDDRGSQFDMRNTAEVSGGARFGPWGMEAKVQNTIGYVSTQRTQTTEEINTELDLDSSVELIFRTDYVPLAHLAGVEEADRIRVNSINPEAEANRVGQERSARATARGSDRSGRSERLDTALRTPAPPPLPTPVDTTRAREAAAGRADPGAASRTGGTGGTGTSGTGTTGTGTTGTGTTGTGGTGTGSTGTGSTGTGGTGTGGTGTGTGGTGTGGTGTGGTGTGGTGTGGTGTGGTGTGGTGTGGTGTGGTGTGGTGTGGTGTGGTGTGGTGTRGAGGGTTGSGTTGTGSGGGSTGGGTR